MKSFAIVLVSSLILGVGVSTAQTSDAPKREFRGAWIATVANIDWPSQPGMPVAQQQAQLISIFDQLKAMGINAAFFQIRPECDALYQSSFEPWSYWLTGKQGQPPSPYYDPLQFAIQQAHARGMELHAWINPYRAVMKVGNYTLDSTHVSVRHPDWILTFGSLKILNPGIPAVRDYITSVIMDIVRRYDVDGIHFDDYFYPYEGITTQDTATFRMYNRGFTNIGDWRRDNVNLFVKEVHDSIEAVKPWVKFGISPFGIWRPGYPSGISGLDAYGTLYADAMAWLHQRTVDYLAPQLYWPNGGGQDYAKLMPWWADSIAANSRDLYVGQAAYRITAWASGEMERHIRQDRANGNVAGSIYFSTNSLTGNFGNFADSLKQYYYRYPALVPSMAWKGTVPPNAPTNVQYAERETGPAALSWDSPAVIGTDTAVRYVVYRFDHPTLSVQDVDGPQGIVSVYDTASVNLPVPSGSGPYYYAATALDRNWNESQMGSLIAVYHPSVPLLAYPSNSFIYGRDTTVLQWKRSPVTASYNLQVSTDSTFSSNLLVNQTGVADTDFVTTGMSGQQKYFWKVSASNAGGTSTFSDEWSFTTAFPVAPVLAGPDSLKTGVTLLPQFSWHPSGTTTKYRLQLTKGVGFSSMVLDTAITSNQVNPPDTSFTVSDSLAGNTIYSWRISAGNEYGFSLWSNAWKFRTEVPTWVALSSGTPTQFSLMQNYPNPFNPTTEISYQLSESSFVTLKVYDILGREVATLVNGHQSPGMHNVTFDASRLPTGVYFYRLDAGTHVATRKMLMLK